MKEDKKTLVGSKIRLVGKECPRCGCRDLDIYKHTFNVGAYCSYCGKYVKFLNPREREEAFCAISAKTKAQILNTKSKSKRKSK